MSTKNSEQIEEQPTLVDQQAESEQDMEMVEQPT